MATLKQFLETGALGPLHTGMSQAAVVSLLGAPQDESIAKHPRILKYGGLQLTFLRNPGAAQMELAHIGLYFQACAEPLPSATSPEDFKATHETTNADMGAFLRQMGLHEFAVVDGADKNSLTLPSGARITFDGGRLHSVIFAARAMLPAKKQISVSVSEDTLEQLKNMARQSNRKVAEMCAEWITQRANDLEYANGAGVSNDG